MGFTEAVSSGFRNYVTFSGRSSRSEYWWWALFVFLADIAFLIVDAVLGTAPALYLLFNLAVILPYFAVAIRRLHDVGRSGWWLLISLVPIIGSIVLLVWLVTRGDSGDNRFGADPLQA